MGYDTFPSLYSYIKIEACITNYMHIIEHPEDLIEGVVEKKIPQLLLGSERRASLDQALCPGQKLQVQRAS